MYRPLAVGVPDRSPFLDVETTIRGLTQDYCTAFNTANYDHVAALFSADGVLMPPNHDLLQGRGSIERCFRARGESGYQDLRMETERLDHAGDMAIETGRYTVSIRRPNGTTMMDRGKFVHSWRRLGAWLMTVDCWNSSLPAVRE
jgi:uncharacterized protein (TIGR02246 family)